MVAKKKDITKNTRILGYYKTSASANARYGHHRDPPNPSEPEKDEWGGNYEIMRKSKDHKELENLMNEQMKWDKYGEYRIKIRTYGFGEWEWQLQKKMEEGWDD